MPNTAAANTHPAGRKDTLLSHEQPAGLRGERRGEPEMEGNTDKRGADVPASLLWRNAFCTKRQDATHQWKRMQKANVTLTCTAQ